MTMRQLNRPLALSIMALLPGAVMAAGESPVVASAFEPYGQLLERYLEEKRTADGGLVSAFDYVGATGDEATNTLIADQVERLEDFDLDQLNSRERALAFWNNAYNFFMIQQILTQLPDGELVASVWDYGGRYNPFADSVFEQSTFTVDGRDYSLNEMEKELLLGEAYAEKGWKDARVHFTVNCASVGCPPLRNVPYTAANIDELLAENTRLAFNTDRHLRVEGDTLHLTELFKWYEDDFVEQGGSVRGFITRWVDEPLAERVQQTNAIEYIDYDWALNRPDNFPEFQ